MYRLIPMRVLRRTSGVKFDEMVPSDIPLIHGIARVIHVPNSISPGPVEDCTPPIKRPWYMHPGQDDNLMVVQGPRYVDIYDPNADKKSTYKEFNVKLIDKPKKAQYDVVVILVAHNIFKKIGIKNIKSFTRKNSIIYDIKYLFSPNDVDGRI